VIETSDVTSLAPTYDRYANALERLSPERLQARRLFLAKPEMLYEREAAGVTYEAFRYELVKRCKEFLRKN